MRIFVATFLAFVYASQAMLGHAGLHLLSGHDHLHLQDGSGDEPRIVRCFHAPGDETPCEHEHHCTHHGSLPGSEELPVHDHGGHDEDDCQICHHLAQAAMTFVSSALMDGIDLVVVFDAPQERFYHAVVVALPQTRGPPAFFA